MNFESHGVLIKNFVLRFENLNSYFLPNNNSYIENNPEMSGFWCVAKALLLPTFTKEDYYVSKIDLLGFFSFSAEHRSYEHH